MSRDDVLTGSRSRNLTVFQRHMIAIARKTLRLPEKGLQDTSGMRKPEARDVLRDVAGWSQCKIEDYERGFVL